MDALPESRREEEMPDRFVLSFIVNVLTDRDLFETLRGRTSGRSDAIGAFKRNRSKLNAP
jgi:hypothetical protein